MSDPATPKNRGATRVAGFTARGLACFHLVTLGSAVLVLISAFNLLGALMEQHQRESVLSRGFTTEAVVVRSTGLQSVFVTWRDEAGQQRDHEAMTRKQGVGRIAAGDRVSIKYLDDASVAPVILSEITDRARENAFWIRSDLVVMATMTVALSLACVFLIQIWKRKPRGRSA